MNFPRIRDGHDLKYGRVDRDGSDGWAQSYSPAPTAGCGVAFVSMTLIRDDSSKVYSLMECPHCEVYESHAAVPDRDGVFQCARCFAMFGDSN